MLVKAGMGMCLPALCWHGLKDRASQLQGNAELSRTGVSSHLFDHGQIIGLTHKETAELSFPSAAEIKPTALRVCSLSCVFIHTRGVG